ncbi:PREDICTED: uncharacterized protein LOC105455708 [Wasmannia auropunctata]|uniref:uncharacterized protein LOC105455708 n=1 Tax=Wasmannia auropunctata TaxID=64793 RepID=UPI0005F04D5E|nr:PREDICTED: uncharacterized protein LOC105455708 [Wasmannia auropunctata]
MRCRNIVIQQRANFSHAKIRRRCVNKKRNTTREGLPRFAQRSQYDILYLREDVILLDFILYDEREMYLHAASGRTKHFRILSLNKLFFMGTISEISSESKKKKVC